MEPDLEGHSKAICVIEMYIFCFLFVWYNLDSKSTINTTAPSAPYHLANHLRQGHTHKLYSGKCCSSSTVSQAPDTHLIVRHGWVGDHHALHWSSLLAAHHALTLRWLLHPHEALEPLRTRQDWLVTCKEETSFELVVPRRTKMKLHGVREPHQPTWRPFTLHVRNAYFLTMHVLLLKSGWGHDSKKFTDISIQGLVLW